MSAIDTLQNQEEVNNFYNAFSVYMYYEHLCCIREILHNFLLRSATTIMVQVKQSVRCVYLGVCMTLLN